MTDARPWCWAPSEDSERGFGPYSTREAAIAAGTDGDKPFVIARCDLSPKGRRFKADPATYEVINERNPR